jgi:hypothetical protein
VRISLVNQLSGVVVLFLIAHQNAILEKLNQVIPAGPNCWAMVAQNCQLTQTKCANNKCQLRYRTRDRLPDGTWGPWGDWVTEVRNFHDLLNLFPDGGFEIAQYFPMCVDHTRKIVDNPIYFDCMGGQPSGTYGRGQFSQSHQCGTVQACAGACTLLSTGWHVCNDGPDQTGTPYGVPFYPCTGIANCGGE